jgi:hypothetical protein
MQRSWIGLGLLVLLVASWPVQPAAGQVVAAAGQVTLDRWVSTTAADFAAGTLDGTALITSTVELTGTAETGSEEAVPVVEGQVQLATGEDWGTYTSAVWDAPVPCRAAGLLYQGRVPDGAALSFEVRSGDGSGEWTAWTPIPVGPWTDPEGLPAAEALVEFPDSHEQLQYRATFTGQASPVLEAVVVVALGAERVPTVKALPPWQESDALPHPVSPARWGSVPSSTEPQTLTITPSVVLIQPATWAVDEPDEAVAALEMLQRYQREILGWDDLLYTYLVDSQGRIYEGRPQLAGNIVHIGLLGAHPHEAISPTAEDALVALVDWWIGSLPAENSGVTVMAPDDPLLAERIQARREVGAFRRNDWFLARGFVSAETDEWVLLTNPSDARVSVTTELYRGSSRIARRIIRVAGLSRASLLIDSLVSPGSLWARISADGDILAERAIYFGHDADDSAGLDVLSRQWYVPAGSQEEGFTTTLALLNPGTVQLTATVTVYTPSGPAAEAAIPLAPRTCLDLPVRDLYTGTTPVGVRVTATGLVAVEQEVRFAGGQAGYGLVGTPVLSRHWTFAGVETEDSALTVLALLNPYTDSVTLTLTLMSEDGTTLRRTYTVLPGAQRLNLNELLPELALAADVQVDRPIAAARLTFLDDVQAAQATLGAVRPSRRWYLPEGSTGEPFEDWLLIANPNDVPTTVALTFLGGAGVLKQVRAAMPAQSRLTVPLNKVLPDVGGFSTTVLADWPVVVERSMYLYDRQGGHACLGIAR